MSITEKSPRTHIQFLKDRLLPPSCHVLFFVLSVESRPLDREMARILRFSTIVPANDSVTENMTKRDIRLRELSNFQASYDFCIPPETGILVTTSDHHEDADFQVFLVGNTQKTTTVYICEGETLPDVFEHVRGNFSRCPIELFNRIKNENDQRGRDGRKLQKK
jgi:hypothetical protein